MLYVDVLVTSKDARTLVLNRYQIHYNMDSVLKLGESREHNTRVLIFTTPVAGVFCSTCGNPH